MRRALVAAVAALCMGLVVSARASAHPLVDEAASRADAADFAGALQALARADAADDLTRDDVLRVLELRATIHAALGNDAAMRLDLERLALLDPERSFGQATPPRVRDAFEAARGQQPLDLLVTADLVRDGVRVGAVLQGPPQDVVREVVVFTQGEGEEWARSADVTEVPLAENAELAYYAEAIGLGGAVLLSAGSRDAPRRITRPRLTPSAAPASTEPLDPAHESGGGISPWVWVGIGGAALVLAGVVLVVIFATSGGQSDVTLLDPPGADFP